MLRGLNARRGRGKGASRVERERVILHCDLNGFFASVECLDQPALRGVPMAVAGDPHDRHGVILAKNELAKARGVKTAETVFEARAKCPNLTLVPPRHARYREISRRVNRIYLSYTSQVEPFGIDESFLDVTGSLGLFGLTPRALADRIRLRVRDEIGITLSVGVSFNKAFAKLGSDMKKPDATTEITRENFRALVWPLPVSALLFVGGATESALKKIGVKTIGDLARQDAGRLCDLLGKSALTLKRYAEGLDEDPVAEFGREEAVKSVGNGMTFRRDLTSVEDIKQGLRALSEQVAQRLRARSLVCKTVKVQIKSPALRTISRQAALARATCLQKEIYDAALSLVLNNWPGGAPIRALTVTACSISDARDQMEQLSLLENQGEEDHRRRERLEEAVYRLRLRHGEGVIGMGADADGELGIRPARAQRADKADGKTSPPG